jgi:hypothetical protein
MEFERELRAEAAGGSLPGTYFTSAGPVAVERTLFKDRMDESGFSVAAMDLRLGTVEPPWTPIAAQQVAWVVAAT